MANNFTSDYSIPHADSDLAILYNGKKNHDKIYAMAIMKNFEGYYRLCSFYKARTASQYRWTVILESSNSQALRKEFEKTISRKIAKGYEKITSDKELDKIGIPSLQDAKRRFEDTINGNEITNVIYDKNRKSGEEEIRKTFECLDDFNISKWFAIGCYYEGCFQKNKLIMVGDDDKPHEVETENFREITN